MRHQLGWDVLFVVEHDDFCAARGASSIVLARQSVGVAPVTSTGTTSTTATFHPPKRRRDRVLGSRRTSAAAAQRVDRSLFRRRGRRASARRAQGAPGRSTETRPMLALGIDLADAVGVAVDDAGKVLRQARGTGSPSARTLLEELAAGHRPDAVGLAADSPGAAFAANGGRSRAPARPGPPRSLPNVGRRRARACAFLCLVAADRVTAGLLLNGEPWLRMRGRSGAGLRSILSNDRITGSSMPAE